MQINMKIGNKGSKFNFEEEKYHFPGLTWAPLDKWARPKIKNITQVNGY